MKEKCICDLKEREEKLLREGSWVNLYISREHGEYFIVALSDGRATMRIHYCPQCGKKL
jgi:hypothetical protein